ncbi:MAG: hypothetical protein AAFR46_08215 [Pseudomonadota bacterium]
MSPLALLHERALILFIFAAGLFATALGPVLAANPDHARAVWSVWPVLVLGGVAVARLIRYGPGPIRTGWLGWWMAGFAFYLIHLWFGFAVIYGADPARVIAGQGLLTAVANTALLVVWGLSILAALLPHEPLGETALHILASLIFLATALPSTLVFADHPVSFAIGLALALLWAAALWRRLA